MSIKQCKLVGVWTSLLLLCYGINKPVLSIRAFIFLKIISFLSASLVTYFESFLDKENLKCQVINNVTQIGGSEQIASGIYLFSFTENGKKQVVEARYSFVVKGGLVINHHSSETPE